MRVRVREPVGHASARGVPAHQLRATLKSYVEDLIDTGGIIVRTDKAHMGTPASGLAFELVDTERVEDEWRIVMDQDRLEAAQAAQERGGFAP